MKISRKQKVFVNGVESDFLKVIPLKLFYYQTFFLKLGIINIHDVNIKKNAIKRWGHCACLRVSRLLTLGYFYWLRVKNSNHLHITAVL